MEDNLWAAEFSRDTETGHTVLLVVQGNQCGYVFDVPEPLDWSKRPAIDLLIDVDKLLADTGAPTLVHLSMDLLSRYVNQCEAKA